MWNAPSKYPRPKPLPPPFTPSPQAWAPPGMRARCSPDTVLWLLLLWTAATRAAYEWTAYPEACYDDGSTRNMHWSMDTDRAGCKDRRAAHPLPAAQASAPRAPKPDHGWGPSRSGNGSGPARPLEGPPTPNGDPSPRKKNAPCAP